MSAQELREALRQLNKVDALAEHFAEAPEMFAYNPMEIVINDKRSLSQQLANEGFTALYIDGEYVLKLKG